MLVVLICFGMNIKLLVYIFLLIEQSETSYNNTACRKMIPELNEFPSYIVYLTTKLQYITTYLKIDLYIIIVRVLPKKTYSAHLYNNLS